MTDPVVSEKDTGSSTINNDGDLTLQKVVSNKIDKGINTDQNITNCPICTQKSEENPEKISREPESINDSNENLNEADVKNDEKDIQVSLNCMEYYNYTRIRNNNMEFISYYFRIDQCLKNLVYDEFK